MAGRGHNYKYTNHAQVVDMKSNNTCTNLKNYPINIKFASGGVIGGSPMICGGFGKASGESKEQSRDECYAYDKLSWAWTLHANLNSERKHLSSSVINGALWVSGGMMAGNVDGTTEYIHANGTVVAGPNLPVARYGHCSVPLHDGKVMIIGGAGDLHRLSYVEKTVLIFSPNNNSFTPGPSFIHNRHGFACTLFSSPMHENRPVAMIAGGIGVGQYKTEILDYTTENAKWEQGKQLLSTKITGHSKTTITALQGRGFMKYQCD